MLWRLNTSGYLCRPRSRKPRNIPIRKNSRNSDRNDLESAYKPNLVENQEFDCYNYFKVDKKINQRFSMILPPPNITGSLHLGHALTATIQDVVVRWKQMEGVECTWVPGIDHAGIATQVIVEKLLWNEKNQTRHDVGRKLFQDCIWKWKEEKHGVIENQLRQLGASLDWSREIFTLDPQQSIAVTKAFIKLFESGLVYRANQLVNWSCTLQSAISDIEVDHIEVDGATQIHVPNYDKPIEFGTLTHFAYKICDSDEEILVATTRPETIIGDVGVAVNPRDDRYSRCIGKFLWHPFRQDRIPIVCDDVVDPNFGTGAVKITPAHDPTDFEIGKRHGLSTLEVIDEKGNLTSVCGELAGLKRFDARNAITALLKSQNLLRKVEEHKMVVPICSRSKDVVEYLVKPQWFIRCSEMAKQAVEDVREGRLIIEPKHYEKVWYDWLTNIRDWCVSRQLWWGHQIPMYFCYNRDQPESSVWVAAENPTEALRKASVRLSTDKIEIQRDEDVLDTWFSSGLLPFTSFSWPQQEFYGDDRYPLDLMETGHDILFFWVARMVMLGTQLTGSLPFKKVLLHGIIRDAEGRKMSKSLGNVVAPEDIIAGSSLENLESKLHESHQLGILSSDELTKALKGQKKMFPSGIPECGADALRFTLCSHNIKNHFINFDVQECYTNKLFCNKIWQATRFTNNAIESIPVEFQKPVEYTQLGLMDRWILSRLSHMVDVCKNALENNDFHLATGAIKDFLYFQFCDVYLETTKRDLRVSNFDCANAHCWTLTLSLHTALKALAPFMPRLAQHLHQRLKEYPGEERTRDYPQNLKYRDETLEKDVDKILEVVVGIRRIKKVFGIVAKHKPEVYVAGDVSFYQDFKTTIEDLSSCHKLTLIPNNQRSELKDAISDRVAIDTSIYLLVPQELRESIEVDGQQTEKKKAKLEKELAKMRKMMSGDNYLLKATPEAQETHNKKVATLEEKLSRINYIQNLSSRK